MNYVTNTDKNIFALYGLPEEVIAVLMAYYSRSPGGLRENLQKMIDSGDIEVPDGPEAIHVGASAKAKAFHEKWVVGYGHQSVAEHAVLHICCENVSIIASKAIEDARLASFTEKSTRYVVFGKDSFVVPDNVDLDIIADTCGNLFDTYLSLMERTMAAIKTRSPELTDNQVKAKSCDLLRGLLPAGTKTNLGITANARTMGNLITKLMSSHLSEVRSIGESILEEARKIVPTLLKYAGASEFRRETLDAASEARVAHNEALAINADGVLIVRSDKLAEQSILASLLLDGASPYDSADADTATLSGLMAKRGPHDPAPRCFEASSLTVFIKTDYGAYRDLQRHRLLTPVIGLLTCAIGWETPQELVELGFADEYDSAMAGAREAWRSVYDNDHAMEAQYVVPLAFRIQMMWTLNFRELFHVCELRSGKQGHPSYRKIAQDLYTEATKLHPWLAPMIRCDMNSYELAR